MHTERCSQSEEAVCGQGDMDSHFLVVSGVSTCVAAGKPSESTPGVGSREERKGVATTRSERREPQSIANQHGEKVRSRVPTYRPQLPDSLRSFALLTEAVAVPGPLHHRIRDA